MTRDEKIYWFCLPCNDYTPADKLSLKLCLPEWVTLVGHRNMVGGPCCPHSPDGCGLHDYSRFLRENEFPRPRPKTG